MICTIHFIFVVPYNQPTNKHTTHKISTWFKPAAFLSNLTLVTTLKTKFLKKFSLKCKK